MTPALKASPSPPLRSLTATVRSAMIAEYRGSGRAADEASACGSGNDPWSAARDHWDRRPRIRHLILRCGRALAGPILDVDDHHEHVHVHLQHVDVDLHEHFDQHLHL